jgi:hypothetical protein
MRCQKCKGQLEPVTRAGTFCFHLCRVCKLRYSREGYLETTTAELVSGFDPLKQSRGIISKIHPGATPVARTALEMLLMNGLWDCYLQGLKDGVLMAYSQDVEQGKPLHGDKDGPLSDASGHPKTD